MLGFALECGVLGQSWWVHEVWPGTSEQPLILPALEPTVRLGAGAGRDRHLEKGCSTGTKKAIRHSLVPEEEDISGT